MQFVREMFNPQPMLIIVGGPPLSGRTELAREVATRRGGALVDARGGAFPADEVRSAFVRGEDVVVDGEFATREERAAALASAPGPARVLLVEWRCGREQAKREAFRRYAGRPRPIEEAALSTFDADLARREPFGDEVPEERLVVVSCGAPLHDQALAVEQALPPQAALSSAPTPERRRLLIVDDDGDTRASLLDVLTELGYDVEAASSAEEALARLDRGPAVDLVLVDQRMPGMSGTDLIAMLRMRLGSPRAILLTAFGDDPTCAAALRAQADNVLAKPLRVVDLQRAVEECLGA